MVEKFKLKLEERQGIKPNALRREGKVPATIYGPGEASVSVQVEEREFSRLPAAAHSHIVELQGAKGAIPAVIRHVQRDHRNRQILNIEFYRVAANRKLTVTVPLKYVGSSPAVQAGGVLQENFSEVHVECLPGDIPDSIEVDVSAITDMDSGIHFSELKIPKNVSITNPAEELVCRVVSPKGETTPAAEGAPAAGEAAAAAPAAAAKE